MLSKETKELLKHFVDLQQNATEQQKEIVKFAIETSNTLEELAKKIGVNQSMISHYITGRSMPALDTLSRICSILDLDANEILCVERTQY